MGAVALLGGFASAYRGRGTGAGDLIISAPIILLGALAYRSAKKRMLGQVASTTARKAGEGIAMALIVALLLPLNSLTTLMASNPEHYVVIPAWAIIAYLFVAFRAPRLAPRTKEP
jgi:hypothetical protein